MDIGHRRQHWLREEMVIVSPSSFPAAAGSVQFRLNHCSCATFATLGRAISGFTQRGRRQGVEFFSCQFRGRWKSRITETAVFIIDFDVDVMQRDAAVIGWEWRFKRPAVITLPRPALGQHRGIGDINIAQHDVVTQAAVPRTQPDAGETDRRSPYAGLFVANIIEVKSRQPPVTLPISSPGTQRSAAASDAAGGGTPRNLTVPSRSTNTIKTPRLIFFHKLT